MKAFKGSLTYITFTIMGLILLIGGWFAAYRLAEPAWEMSHHGYILSEWPHNAANYLRFGLETRSGLVMDYGWLKPEGGFTYRIDHPPLTSLAIALSYAIFGIHEWSARLVPLLFSLGLIVLVFIFVRRIAGNGWALLAAVFAIANPGFLYYARLPVPHVLAMPFVVATFAAYREWTIQKERKYLLAMWGCFAVGCWTDWIVYFVMPWLLLHYLVFHYKARPDRRFLLVGFALPFVLFASHLVWALAVGGMGPLQELMAIFLWRTASTTESAAVSAVVTWGDLYRLSYGWVKLYLTSTVWALALAWVISFLIDAFKRRMSPDDFLVLCLFLYGLVHSIVFRNRAYFHDYLTAFQWLPFFAIAGTLGVRAVVHLFAPRWRLLAGVVLVPLVLWAFFAPIPTTLDGLHRENLQPDSYFAGKKVDEDAPRDARVMVSFRPDIRMAYYMDRPWKAATTERAFDSLLASEPAYSHYVFGPKSTVDEALRKRLIANYAAQARGELVLFDLQSIGGNVLLAGEPENPRRVNVRFGDNLVLLGYDLEPETLSSANEVSAWEQHFNANAEWMPVHNATFQVVYYWRALGAMEADYEIRARFVAEYGTGYVVDQAHEPVNGVYPTSMWEVGGIVREEYEVALPADYPPLRYALRVSVVEKETGRALPVTDVGQASGIDGGEVELGGVELQPRQRPVPVSGAPVIEHRLEQRVGEGLEFLGYAGQLGGKAGESLRAGQRVGVSTYWRCVGALAEDVPVWLEVGRGEVRVRALLGLAPTRLWEPGEVYERRGELELSPYLLPGEYDVRLVAGGGMDERVELGKVRIYGADAPRRVVDQMGVADGEKGDVRPLDTDRELRLSFSLDRAEEVVVRAGWVGESLVDETWVEVYLKNRRGERYVTTWQVPKGRYTVSEARVALGLLVSGENSVILRVPEQGEKPHYVGWRAWVDAVLPDLLYDTSGPHDGWVWADFVRVDTAWREAWGAYRDLAKVYASLEMREEAAELFDRAVEGGLTPERMADLTVFAEAFEALGDAQGLARVDELGLSLVEHPLSLNLEDKVEVLGYSLERQGEDAGELRLYFRALQAMGEDYTLWLHQYGEGREGFESLDRRLSTSQWQTGRVYEERWPVQLEGEKARFVFGLWRWEDGRRLWRKDAPDQHEIDLGWVSPE